MDWISAAIQAGGAISVCGMFLWYLKNMKVEDEEARKTFLQHLVSKDEQASKDRENQLEYLKTRDTQSREVAREGYQALQAVADQVSALRDEIKAKVAENNG